MDKTIITEFDGGWLRFLLSIPLDVLTFMSLLYLSCMLVFYLLGRWRRVSATISGALTFTLFIYYYISVRSNLLNDPSTVLLYTICLLLCLLLFPVILSPKFRIPRLLFMSTLRWFVEYLTALAILLVSLPLFLVIALLVKLTTRGSLFVYEPGCRHSGKPITLYSFRTKVPIYKYKTRVFIMTSESDDRFSWFGRILHKSSLHLLPRLYNVLTGDIHLIGLTPLEVYWKESRFARNIVETEYELVGKLYNVYEGELFRKIVDYRFPVGLITYADLQAYRVLPWEGKVIKTLDQRPSLRKEISYFLDAKLPSIRLFIILIGKFVFRLLSAANLVTLEEVKFDEGKGGGQI